MNDLLPANTNPVDLWIAGVLLTLALLLCVASWCSTWRQR